MATVLHSQSKSRMSLKLSLNDKLSLQEFLSEGMYPIHVHYVTSRGGGGGGGGALNCFLYGGVLLAAPKKGVY